MRPFALTFLAGLALIVVGGAATGAADPAPTTPIGSTPDAGTALCPVGGPAFEDRREPLRTALPSKQTIIGLTHAERRELPRVLPRALTAALSERGEMLASVERDGTISIKSMWRRDRRAAGRLHVTGARIDADGGRFFADLNRTYRRQRHAPFIPGSLNFSEPGCWRVTARAGQVRATYVVLVRLPLPDEFAEFER